MIASDDAHERGRVERRARARSGNRRARRRGACGRPGAHDRRSGSAAPGHRRPGPRRRRSLRAGARLHGRPARTGPGRARAGVARSDSRARRRARDRRAPHRPHQVRRARARRTGRRRTRRRGRVRRIRRAAPPRPRLGPARARERTPRRHPRTAPAPRETVEVAAPGAGPRRGRRRPTCTPAGAVARWSSSRFHANELNQASSRWLTVSKPSRSSRSRLSDDSPASRASAHSYSSRAAWRRWASALTSSSSTSMFTTASIRPRPASRAPSISTSTAVAVAPAIVTCSPSRRVVVRVSCRRSTSTSSASISTLLGVPRTSLQHASAAVTEGEKRAVACEAAEQRPVLRKRANAGGRARPGQRGARRAEVVLFQWVAGRRGGDERGAEQVRPHAQRDLSDARLEPPFGQRRQQRTCHQPLLVERRAADRRGAARVPVEVLEVVPPESLPDAQPLHDRPLAEHLVEVGLRVAGPAEPRHARYGLAPPAAHAPEQR